MVSLAQQINDRGLTYNTLNGNSNTFVRSLPESVDAWAYPTPTPAGLELIYPGGDRTLVDDIFHGSQGWTIQGTNGDDHVFALFDHDRISNPNNGDYVIGYDGDDTLYSGNRSDVLEGGSGDDTFILEDDLYASDIVIVGEGSDTIIGGDRNDRLVIRLSNIDLDPSATFSGDVETTAIPLLGGFKDIDEPSFARWEPSSESLTSSEIGPDLEIYVPSVFPVADTPIWSSLTNSENRAPFMFGYWSEGGDLGIYISQRAKEAFVTIKDFQEGDFGIYMFDKSQYSYTMVSSYDETESIDDYYIADVAGVNWINNSGNFVEVPAYEYII